MKNKYTVLIYSILLLYTLNSSAQLPFSPPPLTLETPSWAKTLFETPLNLNKIDSAYRAYFEVNTYKKDNYIRYYFRISRLLASFRNLDGTITYPSQEAYNTLANDIKTQQNVAKKFSKTQSNLKTAAAVWEPVGPMSTWHAAATPVNIAAQVNIYSVDVSKSNTNILFAGTETGSIFKSVDKGISWLCVSNSYNFNGLLAVQIHPTNPNIVLASASSKGIFKSDDGGLTWTRVLAVTYINSICWVSSTKVLCGGDDGVFSSNDGGVTWTKIDSYICYDVAINPNNANYVYYLRKNASNVTEFMKSSDGGASFSVKSLNSGITVSDGSRIGVTKANSNVIYVGLLDWTANPKVVKSTDMGDTWAISATGGSTALGMNNGQGYYDFDIMVSATNADHVIIGTTTSFKSTDGGVNYYALGGYWGQLNLHPDFQEMLSIGNESYMATDGGLYYSTDFFSTNANYFVRSKGIYASDYWNYDHGWHEDLMVGGRYHNGNAAIADWLGYDNSLIINGGEDATGWVLSGRSRHTVYNDYGPNHVIIPLALTTSYTFSQKHFNKHPNMDTYGIYPGNLVIDPIYYMVNYVGKDNSLWRTNTGGDTWMEVKNFGARVRRFEVFGTNSDFIYVCHDNGISHTTDGGSTWRTLNTSFFGPGYAQITLSYENPNELWVLPLSTNDIFYSNDAGKSFVNWKTNTMASQTYDRLCHQGGTNGLVYIFTRDAGTNINKVFYRDKTMNDWVEYAQNYPAGYNLRRVLPYYPKAKLRAAGSRGIWQVDFVTNSRTIQQPTMPNKVIECNTPIQFDDHSILTQPYANTQWKWFFPGATMVSNPNIRNPIVTYDTPGNYVATQKITDATGQVYYKSLEFTVCINKISIGMGCNNPISIRAKITNTNCPTMNSGKIDLIVSGGSGNYGYSWSNGASTQNISNLTDGLYRVTVSDGTCTNTQSFLVTQASPIIVTPNITNVSACDEKNGKVSFNITGGMAPYIVNWPDKITSDNRSNLKPGSYNVIVKDQYGCQATANVNLTNQSMFVNSTKTNVAVNDQNTGNITLQVSNGVGPYTFNWSHGATTQNLSSLKPDTYTVLVKDSENCTRSHTVVINSITY